MKRVRASENDQDGIRLDGPGGGNRVELCSGTANQGPGISVQAGSTANTLQNNVALGNDAIDLFDENPDCGANLEEERVRDAQRAMHPLTAGPLASGAATSRPAKRPAEGPLSCAGRIGDEQPRPNPLQHSGRAFQK